MAKTKIVATIGPATVTPDMLRGLKAAGMSMARLNGSHANLDWHRHAIATIRKVLPDVPILLDIPGRKIRTTQLAHEPEFDVGDIIVLTTDKSHDGTKKVPVNYAQLHEDLSTGNTILADDGTLRFTVTEVSSSDISCRAETKGKLKSCKGINVPFVTLQTKTVTPRDVQMIGFAKETGVDFIGISFVESASHIEEIRAVIGQAFPKIVAKVENRGGIENLEEIVKATDVIMIDRGDLSVETALESVAMMQKKIILAARKEARPVIVATEMLHSMIENSFPTKAEVSDITNAVLDGAAALMLSGETAIGKYPVETVALMRRVADITTSMDEKIQPLGDGELGSIPDAMQVAVSLLSQRLPVTKIVAITISGYAAHRLSSCLPDQPILAVTNDRPTARSFNLLPGTEGVYVDVEFSRTGTEHIPKCLETLWRGGKIEAQDMILVISLVYPRSGNRMNLIEAHQVQDLMDTFGWKRG